MSDPQGPPKVLGAESSVEQIIHKANRALHFAGDSQQAASTAPWLPVFNLVWPLRSFHQTIPELDSKQKAINSIIAQVRCRDVIAETTYQYRRQQAVCGEPWRRCVAYER